MAQNSEIDLQAQSILRGLISLEELLDETVAKEALDLSKNAATAAQYQILARLKRSLTQYLQRQGDLLYVGMLGHFSTGKSSTINSILGLWRGPNERETGLNPTDTTITLITQANNANSLLGVIREGHVTIRYQAVDSPLLANIVIADTPGTGDPHLIEEIAREFLPICDVILFLLSAASPLDQTDMPLLLELHRRLPFIPIMFVITRSDELIADRAKPLSDKNIDEQRRAKFMQEIVARTNKLLSPEVYMEEQFILIDNKSQYNIEKLVNLLLEKSDPANPTSRISMHSHKLHFYSSSSKELRDFFGAFLDSKLEELTKIVDAATKNIGKYNELVRISNDNLTKTWIDRHLAINKVREEAINQIGNTLDLPDTVFNFSSVSRVKSDISRDVSDLAQSFAHQISTRIKLETQAQIKDYLYDIREKVLKIPLGELTAGSHGTASITLRSQITNIEMLPRTRLMRFWQDIRDSQARALDSSTDDVHQKVTRLQKLLQARQPLPTCSGELDMAQESLRTDLSRFFDTVELYRDGVFSHRTKASISTLGIGKELDDLESGFDEEDKAAYTNDALAAMFPAYSANYDRCSKIMSRLEEEIRNLSSETKKMQTYPSHQEKFTSDIELAELEASLRENLHRELQTDADKLIDNARSSIAAFLAETRSTYDREVALAKKNNRNRYIFLSVSLGLALLSGYLGYTYLKGPVSTSLFATIGWGVLSNLIGDGVGLAIARLRDHLPETVGEIQDRLKAKLRDELRKIADAQISNYQFSQANEAVLASRFISAYNKVLSMGPVEWQAENTRLLSELKKLQGSFRKLRGEATSAIIDLCASCARYFDDSAHNLEILNEIAARIKEIAIEPSSSLLEGTRTRLSDVRNKIGAVSF